MKPIISIIIPTFNRNFLLHETLQSVQKQSFMFWECLIVDDGNSKATEEIVKEFSEKDNRIKYYTKPLGYPSGASSSRNYGFQMSSGSYIQWLDDDDLLSENKLELQYEQLKFFNDYKIFCTCNWDYYWEGKVLEIKNMMGDRKKLNVESYFALSRNTLSFIPIHSFLIHRELILKSGLWNIHLTINDDGEFLTRILLHSQYLLKTEECYVLYRAHLDNRLSKKENSDLPGLLLSLRLMHSYTKGKSIYYKKYFTWKLLKIFHQFWKTDKEFIKNNKDFFREVGVNIKLANYYFFRYSIYKIVYPIYKKKIKR